MERYSNLISHGVLEGLQSVKFHSDAPFLRRLMSNFSDSYSIGKHIAVHEIKNNLSLKHRSYTELHAHNCDEWNIILSFEKLVFEICLDNESYEVSAPATVYIPQGLLHSANVLEGSGFYICVLDTSDYNNSFI